LKIAYFDCFSGISGDMCLGALVDAGASIKEIEKKIRKLPFKGYSLSEKRVRRSGFKATQVEVIMESATKIPSPSATRRGKKAEVRKWADIKKIIKTAALSEDIKQKAHEIFRRLFEAESRVHGESIHKVHLHELGCVDCLVDIFGTLIGLELLGVERVHSSPINLGQGSVQTVHCTLPVPAPATAEILKNVPVYSSGIPFELTTPTGAAIIKSISTGFGETPVFSPETIGNGAGSMKFKNRPNILRVLIGNMYKNSFHENVTVIEANIDDMNPQIYEYLIEKLLREGALDVYMTHIIMKKTRPGIKLSVLCDENRRDDLIGLILKETTTIGARYYKTSRIAMDRKFQDIQTKHGIVKFKISNYKNSNLKYTPEYDDCKKIAKKTGIPLLEIIEEAQRKAKRKIK
jgi:uncharacterized protein (TIGR00299 family) protein